MSENASVTDTENTENEPNPYSRYYYIGAAFITIICGVGQGIFLPLFISTFTSTTCDAGIETGSYFVLFIMSTLFNIPFALACGYDYYRGTLDKTMMKNHYGILVLIGICDAFNGLLVVFASALSRTSGDLQAILVQLTIPFTLLFSRILKVRGHEITGKKGIAVFVVIVGVFIGIIPNFIHSFSDGVSSSKSLWYPFMFAVAAIPGVLTNVLQHKIFDNDPTYNRNWLLLGESFFQFVTVGLLFWFDLIPHVGTSPNFEKFKDNFNFGVECFFTPGSVGGRCPYSWIMGLAFAVSYCGSYYSASYLIQNGSANFSAMASAISTPIQIIMWYTITPMTRWGCGEEYSLFQILMGCFAIPFLFGGALYFRSHDTREQPTNAYERVHEENEDDG